MCVCVCVCLFVCVFVREKKSKRIFLLMMAYF